MERASKVTFGPDPSVGTKYIYGLDPNDGDATDALLLPPGLTDTEGRKEFYDIAMDVASLPGGYKLTDDDGFGNTEAILQLVGRARVSPYRNWRRQAYNALARVSSNQEVFSFISDVEKVILRHRQAQENRMRAFMYESGHSRDVVDYYVRLGALPRIVELTYECYSALLNLARQTVYEFQVATWKGSYAERMVQHHALELGQIRETSANYRALLLDTYIYLRNARKDKFQDPSFTRALLYRTMGQYGGGDAPSEPTPGAPSPGASNRCKHCRRQGIHSGTSKNDCPLQGLPARRAQGALSNLDKAKAKAVALAIRDGLTADPSQDVDSLIATCRSASA
jgi:hypothetical protein